MHCMLTYLFTPPSKPSSPKMTKDEGHRTKDSGQQTFDLSPLSSVAPPALTLHTLQNVSHELQ